MIPTAYANILGTRKDGKRRQNADIDAKTGQHDHAAKALREP
jgi:hypothetical protein